MILIISTIRTIYFENYNNYHSKKKNKIILSESLYLSTHMSYMNITSFTKLLSRIYIPESKRQVGKLNSTCLRIV